MNTLLKTFIFSIILFSLPVYATTYYIDATNGQDFFIGTSPDAPWRTVSKINNSVFQPGDSILFKRGETWKENLNFPSSGNAFQPIVIGSYGEGELPVLTGVDVYEGWDNPGNWALDRTNIWVRKQDYNPQRLWINDKEVLRNEVIDSLDGVRYVWAWEDSKIYVYSEGNPANSFMSMKTNFLYTVVGVYGKNYLIIQDIEIQGGYVFALTLAGCGRVTVKDCRIGSYSRQGIQIRNEGATSSVYVTVDNCILDSKFNFSYGKNKGIDDGIQIVGGANNCVVKNSTIADFGHTGIYLKSLHPEDNGVYDNKIFGNLITAENVTYQRGFGTDGYEGKCRNNEIFNNIVRNTNVRSQINGNDNWIHHNIFDGITNSMLRTYGVGQAIDLQGYGDNFACSGNKIDNNLIMNCDEPGITFSGNGNAKKNNYVRNNILFNCGRNSKDGYDNIGIAIKNSGTIETNYFYNNCVFSGDEISPSFFVRGEYLTAEEFNSLNSSLDVAANNIQKNPMLEILDSLNIYLTENSPCIDAGIDVGLSYDYYGNLIYSGNAPDIGIQEYYGVSEVEDRDDVGLMKFELFQNYPNPFSKGSFGNPTTTIKYSIPSQQGSNISNDTQQIVHRTLRASPRQGGVRNDVANVTLKVYDILGREVATLVNQKQAPGNYSVQFNASSAMGGLPSGIYFYKLTAGELVKVRKMILVK